MDECVFASGSLVTYTVINSPVGVIGSGRGMTGFQQRGKHQYNADTNVDEE